MTAGLERAVALRFSAGADAYDRCAEIQRGAAEELVRRIPAGRPRRILEIGCGTGLLTRLAAEAFPQAEIDAIDPSPGMLALARDRLAGRPGVRWHHQDLLQWQSPVRYPLILSNAALHWIWPLEQGMRAIRDRSAPGADIVCSLMLDGTFHELHRARREAVPQCPPRRSLPDRDTVIEALDRAGLALRHQQVAEQTVTYPSARDLLRAIHAMGLTGGGLSQGARPLVRGELERLAETYQQRFGLPHGAVPATYRILWFHARAPGDPA